MARAYNGGWDFVKVGGTYQYKEDHLICMVKVLEDNSDDERYRFKLQIQLANCDAIGPNPIDISHGKKNRGYYSGMMQFYERPEYIVETWHVDYTNNQTT